MFNRFIESIIPAPDRDDDLLAERDQPSPTRRSAGFGRENRSAAGNSYAYKSGNTKANDRDDG